MEFTSLKRESAPIAIRQNISRPVVCSSIFDKKSRTSNRMSFKWSESMVEKVRSSRRRFTDSWMGRVICCLPKHTRDTKMLSKQIDDLPQFRFDLFVLIVRGEKIANLDWPLIGGGAHSSRGINELLLIPGRISLTGYVWCN